MHPNRRQARFLSRQIVEVAAPDRGEVAKLWTENISQGGLYVTTSDPPPLRTRVDVILTVPSGKLKMSAEVVHIMDTASAAIAGMEAGVGLAFMELSDKNEKALREYCDGLAADLQAAATLDLPSASGAASLSEVVAAAQRLVQGSEGNDLYAAIGVSNSEPQASLMARFDKLAELFSTTPPGATPAQKTRIGNAERLLVRLRRLLGDPARRLDYDLRSGFVHADTLASKPLAEQRALRDAWKAAFPDRFEEAKAKAIAAAALAVKSEHGKAVELGQQALRLDPFNNALRTVVREWRRHAKS